MSSPTDSSEEEQGPLTFHDTETVNYRKDGTDFINHWSIAPIFDAEGEVCYWVSVQRDVTEKRRLQREVVRALDEERRRIGRDLHDSGGRRSLLRACVWTPCRTTRGWIRTLRIDCRTFGRRSFAGTRPFGDYSRG